MKLERLELQSLPGIRPGFAVDDLDPGITLISGPNASGKSSLIRALRYLLTGPRDDDPPALALAADFRDGDRRWQVRRAGRQIVWQLDGRPSDPPPLPDPETLHCYLMQIEDLIGIGRDRDQALAARLRRELHGGFDIDALRGDAFRFGSGKGRIERGKLISARQKRQQVESEYLALAGEERRLPELDREIDQGRDAPARQKAAELALDRLNKDARRIELETRLEEYPEDMARLVGNEGTRLEELDQQLEQARREREQEQQNRAGAHAELQASGLADDAPEPEQLESLERRLRTLEQRGQEQRQLNERLSEARATLQRAAQDLRLGSPSETPPRLAPEQLRNAEALARQLHQLQQRRDQLETELVDAEPAPAEADIDDHRRARDLLRNWLAQPARRPPSAWPPAILAVLGGLAAAAEWALPHLHPAPPALPDWLAAAGGGLALLAALWLWLARPRAIDRPLREAFDATQLAPPAAWERTNVGARLHELEHALTSLERQKLQATEMLAAEKSLRRVTHDLETLNQRREALARQTGFNPTLCGLEFDRYVRLAGEYDRARDQVRECEDRLATLAGELEAGRRECSRRLRAWRASDTNGDDDPPPDLDALRAAVEGLVRRTQSAASAREQLRAADQRIQRIDREQTRVTDARGQLLSEVGLDPDQSGELARRLARLDEWRDLRRRCDELKAELRRLDRELEQHADPDTRARLEAGDVAGLEQDLALAREQSEIRQRLIDERAELRATLKQAGADRRLEQALGLEQQAHDALHGMREQALIAAGAEFLVDEVEQEFQRHHEPELLTRARSRFNRYTHQAWDLEVDAATEFVAVETASGLRHAPETLSTATRMQLLLALRMSWAEHQERGRKALPLILDEALTTSDAERFAAVVQSLEQLANDEDRQIIYLAAGAHELALWQQISGHTPAHIDLGALRANRAAGEFHLASRPESPPIPAPGDHDADAYARLLNVPALDPRQPASAQHLFWLLNDDLDLLHRLLEAWRLRRVGQLQHLLNGPAAPEVVKNPDRRLQLEARIELIGQWTEAWRIGRGRAVTRGDLEQADGISDQKIDEVSALAERLKGDPETLLEALDQGEVKYFKQVQRERLRQWLLDHGLLDPRPVLDAAQRRQRVLERMAGRLPPREIHAGIDLLERGLPAPKSVTRGDAAAGAPDKDG